METTIGLKIPPQSWMTSKYTWASQYQEVPKHSNRQKSLEHCFLLWVFKFTFLRQQLSHETLTSELPNPRHQLRLLYPRLVLKSRFLLTLGLGRQPQDAHGLYTPTVQPLWSSLSLPPCIPSFSLLGSESVFYVFQLNHPFKNLKTFLSRILLFSTRAVSK